MATPPRFASNNSTVINREMRSWQTEDKIWDNQTDFIARFSTGRNRARTCNRHQHRTREQRRLTRTAGNMHTTLLDPNPDDVFTGEITVSPIVGDVTANSQAVYVDRHSKAGQQMGAERRTALGPLRC